MMAIRDYDPHIHGWYDRVGNWHFPKFNPINWELLYRPDFDYWEEVKMKGRKNMKTDKIIVIMDRSGSMTGLRQDAIGGFNTFIADQKKVEGNATVTLVQFDNEYNVCYSDVPLMNVKNMTDLDFIPRGSTALLDAIGRTVNEMNAKGCPHCDGKNIYVIITDGEENASKEFTRKQIFDMITHARDCHKSEFIFLAANQDAIAEGGSIGIDSKWCHTYEGTGIGTQIMYNTSSNMVRSLRTNGDSD